MYAHINIGIWIRNILPGGVSRCSWHLWLLCKEEISTSSSTKAMHTVLLLIFNRRIHASHKRKLALCTASLFFVGTGKMRRKIVWYEKVAIFLQGWESKFGAHRNCLMKFLLVHQFCLQLPVAAVAKKEFNAFFMRIWFHIWLPALRNCIKCSVHTNTQVEI